MKTIYSILLLVFALHIFAQTPQGFNYSAVARDGAGKPLANKNIKVQISILKGNANGAVQYTETHLVNSDVYGLFNLVVGNGTVVTGTLSNLPWGADNYFLKTAIDANGGTNFLTMGTTQLLSVPYAMHAKTADSILGVGNGSQQLSVSLTGDTLSLENGGFVIIPGLSGANRTIKINCNDVQTSIIDVTNPITNKTWMDRNLGAERVALSSDDSLAFGDLYQWGRGSDGHQCRNSKITLNISIYDNPSHGFFISNGSNWLSPVNDNLWQGINGVNNPCPRGYRLPTEAELNEERLSWIMQNNYGAFNSTLKFTTSFYRGADGLMNTFNSYGAYWSSNSNSINNDNGSAKNLSFHPAGAEIDSNVKTNGLSVRCIKD